MYIDLYEDRLRGQFRMANDEVQLRRLFLSCLAGVLLMALAMNLEVAPNAMAAVYLLGFIVLGYALWSVTQVVNLPQTIELDLKRFSIGDDEFQLDQIDRVDATDGPPKLVVVLRDGTRHVWNANETHHNLDDVAWLAEQVRSRLP